MLPLLWQEAGLRQSAEEFEQTVALARQRAAMRRSPTRIVFASQELEDATRGFVGKKRSYAVYEFVVPSLPSEQVQAQSSDPTSQAGQTAVTRPSGFVGEWIPCAVAPAWKTLSKVTVISCNFLNTNDFSALRNFYKWPHDGWSLKEGSVNGFLFSPTSCYPVNYAQTPYPSSYPFLTNAPAPNEDVPASSQRYADIWPQDRGYDYFETTGSDNFGAVETSTNAPRRFFDLPMIEFDSSGMLNTEKDGVFEVVFSHPTVSQKSYMVRVTRSGQSFEFLR